MAKIEQAGLEKHILNGQPHTYIGLCLVYGADDTQAMQIDRTLQKLRRKKLIAFIREGKEVIWKKVPVVEKSAEADWTTA